MSSAFVVLPPNVVRKTLSELSAMLPGLHLVPHNTHGELDQYFAREFGDPEVTHDLTVTAYPAALAPEVGLDSSGVFEPLPSHLPPMRPELQSLGMAEPNRYMRVVAVVPLIFIHHKSLTPPPQSWQDLCHPSLRGKVVCPPNDTPMPALSRAFLGQLYGGQGREAAQDFKAEMYPLDINKAVDQGQYLAGLAIPAFGRNFRDKGGAMVWPKEGGVAIPIVAMLKKGAGADALEALDHLFSPQFQEFLSLSGVLYPVLAGTPLPPEMEPPARLLWLGWEQWTILAMAARQCGARGGAPAGGSATTTP